MSTEWLPILLGNTKAYAWFSNCKCRRYLLCHSCSLMASRKWYSGGMESEKVEFVKFGTRPRDNHTYALDSNNAVWVNVEADLWESLEKEPRQIHQALTTDQLIQIMAMNRITIV